MNIKPPENVRLKKQEGADLKEKAFELTLQKGDYVMPSELVHFLIENCLDMVEIKNGVLSLKVS